MDHLLKSWSSHSPLNNVNINNYLLLSYNGQKGDTTGYDRPLYTLLRIDSTEPNLCFATNRLNSIPLSLWLRLTNPQVNSVDPHLKRLSSANRSLHTDLTLRRNFDSTNFGFNSWICEWILNFFEKFFPTTQISYFMVLKAIAISPKYAFSTLEKVAQY